MAQTLLKTAPEQYLKSKHPKHNYTALAGQTLTLTFKQSMVNAQSL
jgi:hypothetical protein